MSQNYKIVERLNKTADAAMYPEGSPYQGDSPFGEQIREAASLIQELGKALETISSIAAGSQTINSFPNIQRIADTILSKLKEA